MAIQKVENVWSAGVNPPPSLAEILTEQQTEVPTAAPETPISDETAPIETDTIAPTLHYRVTEEMERATEAALIASEQSLDAVQAAQDADRNARDVTKVTENSIREAQQAIEQTQDFIAVTNQAAERALQATRAARQASLTAVEFTRSGAINLEEMEASINSSKQRMQNTDSNQLFQRTLSLKQQTAALRQQLNNL